MNVRTPEHFRTQIALLRVAADTVLELLAKAPTSRRADDVAAQLAASARFASQYADALRERERQEAREARQEAR